MSNYMQSALDLIAAKSAYNKPVYDVVTTCSAICWMM
jgi:hypothetical protein